MRIFSAKLIGTRPDLQIDLLCAFPMFRRAIERATMQKNHRPSLTSSPKMTKHQQEMDVLRAHHERLLSNSVLRQASLVEAGVFVRTVDGELAVAKPYDQVITSKHAA